MKIGSTYNWKHDPSTKLIYLGNNWSGNGYWHQFTLVDKPNEVWCEVKDEQLSLMEESK